MSRPKVRAIGRGSPIVMMPSEWLALPITDGEFRVLAAVCQYATLGSDDGCLRSYEKLAERVGMHRDSVRRAVRRLVALEVVEVETRGGEDTGTRSTTNRIAPNWDATIETVTEALQLLATTEGEGDPTAPLDPSAQGDRPAPGEGDCTAPPTTLNHPVRNRPALLLDSVSRLRAAMGDHAPAWDTLAIALPAPASREGMAAALLMGLQGGGTTARPITAADLSAGIKTALSMVDRPTDRLILGCAVNAANTPSVGTASGRDGAADERAGDRRGGNPTATPKDRKRAPASPVTPLRRLT